MGGTNSQIAPLLEYSPVRQLSTEHHINEWDDLGTKNYAYYAGQRFTVIPSAYYTTHTRGYIWGWYVDKSE